MPVSDAEISQGRVSDEEVFNLPPSMARTATDWATSAIRGMAKGAMSLAGTPGDVMDYGARGLEYAAEKTGMIPPVTEEQHQKISRVLRPLPTTAENIEKLELLTGKLGKPKTEGGKYAETIGELVPAVAGGAGGIVRKGLQAIGGGAGSEYAGQKAKEWLGDKAEPFARFAGAIPGLLTGGRIGTALKKDTTPTAEALEKAKDDAYEAARQLPLELNRTGMDKLTTSIEADLKAAGHRDYSGMQPATFKVIGELREPAGHNATVTDIDAVRKVLGKLGANKDERAAARLAIERIDDYLGNVPAGHVVKGDPTAVSEIFRNARGNYAPLVRSQLIQEAIERAKNAAGASGSGANFNNALRTQIKIILNDPKKIRGFSDQEVEQMQHIVRGGPISNAMRTLGKLAPTGAVSSLPTLLTFMAKGGDAAGAMAGAGLTGKALGEHFTNKEVSELDRMIRSRSALNKGPVYRPVSPEGIGIDAMVRSAIGSDGGTR